MAYGKCSCVSEDGETAKEQDYKGELENGKDDFEEGCEICGRTLVWNGNLTGRL